MSTVPKACAKCGLAKVWSGTRWYCRPCQSSAERARKSRLSEAAREAERLRANLLRNMRHEKWTPEQRRSANQRVAAWRESHREQHRQGTRDWYRANASERRQKKVAEYYANPEPFLARNLLRKARRIEAVCSHGEDCVSPEFLASLYGASCRYCDSLATEADHFYPLSRQGLHCRENLVPSCLPCNRSKHASDPHEWMASRA